MLLCLQSLSSKLEMREICVYTDDELRHHRMVDLRTTFRGVREVTLGEREFV